MMHDVMVIYRYACMCFYKNYKRKSINNSFSISVVFHQFFTVFQIHLVYDIRMEKVNGYEQTTYKRRNL